MVSPSQRLAQGGRLAWEDLESDEATRVRLAARPSTPSTLLRVLAKDPSLTVRAAVAMNTAHAPGADRRLLADGDERIRALLARKMARLLPGLSRAGRTAAHAHVEHTLKVLAQDAAVRVRAALADALMLMPEAPRDIILRLARDADVTVSAPIARSSPLLSDADLIALLSSAAMHTGLAETVAGRKNLGPTVADHIAAYADDPAIRILLQNESANIQDATLDALIKRAGAHPDWHEPLACRPKLPVGGMRTLSNIVAAHVLEVLLNRPDMPGTLAETLRTRFNNRLSQEPAPGTTFSPHNRHAGAIAIQNPTEAALMQAAQSGNDQQVALLLAEASRVNIAVVKRAISLRSAKALISLSWKAGFSMQAAQAVQSALGRLDPRDILIPGQQGEYPMSADELGWQFGLLKDGDR